MFRECVMPQVFMQTAPELALKMKVHIWIELPHPGDNRMRMWRAHTRATTFAADVLIREIGVAYTTPEGQMTDGGRDLSTLALTTWKGRRHAKVD